MTRVAVVGRGDVSVVHLAAIEKLGAELVGADQQPDVVHICTPHDQHVPLAIEALESGAHVFLEKPVAHTVEEAERLVAAAKDFPHLKVGVCLQNRYNTASSVARQRLKSLGSVKGASATVMWHRTPEYYQAKPWRGQKARSGGGVLINQAIHTVDLLQWLVGEVVTVNGDAGTYSGYDIDVEDTASLILDHENGARSVLFATVTNAVDSPVTIEIVTDKATLLLRGDLTITHQDGTVEVIAERRASSGGRSYWGASHELIIADFYRSLADPEPFWIGPGEALKSQLIIDAVYRRNN
ncbi:Gfo/Idh/MocA family protein [Actinoplanes sp. CA-142083]|uniref:Gfo/Idh/MocA family protein n=1 Tax=Actinoplanes sp. CA-142083 TaxID=3239903 RepID=UPI003D93D125